MTVKSAMKSYRAVLAKLNALSYMNSVVYYDATTAAPVRGAERRGAAFEYISAESYRLSTSHRMKDALAFLTEHTDELTPVERREIELRNRENEYISSIPADEYVAYSGLLNTADSVWHKAKAENDFAAFLPYLTDIFDCSRKFAGYYKPDTAPYDVCLGQYERGLTTDSADRFFGLLRERLVPLIHKISEKAQPDNSFLHKDYPLHLQREFSDRIMELMAIDRERCAIGETEHPYTINMCRDDVRITTNYKENAVESSMFSVIHEGGHAIYELGSGKEYEGTPLAGGVSMGIHESQSRLYENMIGRSRAFIGLLFPVMKELFPSQLDGVCADDMYLAVNRSEPSLIRTEADELTYPLHIMIRYEIERGVMEDKYAVAELPSVWNSKYKEYLGIDVPDDTHGVLQDSHWSMGSVGYFPSYALGSAYAAQFMHVMQGEFDVDASIRSGSLSQINDWLDDRIHRHGCRFDPSELIGMVCGESFNPDYYVDYLTGKYSEIYGI